jgi:hypothetical protein
VDDNIRMAAVVLSALLITFVRTAGPHNPRTTRTEVAQYREIIEVYRTP